MARDSEHVSPHRLSTYDASSRGVHFVLGILSSPLVTCGHFTLEQALEEDGLVAVDEGGELEGTTDKLEIGYWRQLPSRRT